MNRLDLQKKLDSIGVNENQYSLDGDLKPDSIILFHSYEVWQVFYLDERGGRNDLKSFQSESAACMHIFELFSEAKRVETKFK